MTLKKVLMIVHDFPPIGSPASIRYLEFAKHLEKFGWKAIILTVKNPSRLRTRDLSLKVPSKLKVYRSVSLPTYDLMKVMKYFIGKYVNLFFFPDSWIGWIPHSIRKGFSIIRKEKIDLIFVGCSPDSAAFIGYFLKKLTKKPLVIDFRDPYAENIYNYYPNRIYKYMNKKLEQKFIQSANRVITVTPSCIRYFPYKEKFSVITNGYFDLLKNEKKPVKKYQQFTFATVGTIYSSKIWINFFKALKIFQQKSQFKSIQILFIGYKHKEIIDPIARKLKVTNLVKYVGYVPNEECNLLMKKSHVLVINLPPEKDIALVVKIFSAIHSDSPIFGIMNPSNETAKFIQKSNVGIVVRNKTQEILKGLMKLSKVKGFERNWDYIKLFDRRKLTERLAGLFNEVIEECE